MKLKHLHKQEFFPSSEQVVHVLFNPAHKSFEAHDHDFFEIGLIVSGQASHRSVEGEGILSAGDIFVLRPGAWHEYLGWSDFSIYNCMFSRDLFNHELAWVLNDPILYPIFLGGDPSHRLFLSHLGREDFALGRKCVEALLKLNNSPSVFRFQQIGLLLQVMGIIAQARSASLPKIPTQREKLHPSTVRAMNLLESKLEHPWTLGELAQSMNINPSYLARLFKKGIGMPPITYLAHCRDRRAADLLIATELPIAELAQKVGWDDPNYFARRFSRNFGKTPSAYRRYHAR